MPLCKITLKWRRPSNLKKKHFIPKYSLEKKRRYQVTKNTCFRETMFLMDTFCQLRLLTSEKKQTAPVTCRQNWRPFTKISHYMT